MFKTALCLIPVLLASPCSADDWPQWMGPQRDGFWRESGLLEKFPDSGAKILWRTPVGAGYSGPSVAQGQVFVMDFVATDKASVPAPSAGARNKISGQERIVCLDATTGKELWTFAYDCPYDLSYPLGPRCTVTIHEGKAYALGAMGHFHCLDAATGKILWAKDFAKDYQAETPYWGYSSHPLVTGNKVITLLGVKEGVVAAFDKDTGKELWRSLDAKEPGYAPVALATAGGTDQIIAWTSETLSGLNPATGAPFWQFPLKPQYAMSIMMPLVHGGTVFAGGMGAISAAYKLDSAKPEATLLWEGRPNNSLGPKNSTPVIEDGLMYGFDKDGELRCVDLATGQRLWTTLEPLGGRGLNSGTAFLVKTSDYFLIFTEMGELITARLTREGYTQISKAKVLEPTSLHANRKVIWSHPAFANKCAYVRNDAELICVSLAQE